MSKRKATRARKARFASRAGAKAFPDGLPPIINRARIRSRRGAQPPSQPSGTTIAAIMQSTGWQAAFGAGGSLPPWCARSSGCGWSRRRPRASACIASLPAKLPPSLGGREPARDGFGLVQPSFSGPTLIARQASRPIALRTVMNAARRSTMSYTLAEAAKAVGMNKTSILLAIKSGRMTTAVSSYDCTVR